MMHAPTAALHDAAEADRQQLVRMIERLFQVRGRE